ncbi:alpha-galactosidase [Pseudoclavibacter chungangensis]|uniref:alpha-galactosidase n=1 Tax=Pseudoclavibacter chungangensis TaxID=587635 RepID=A0A7J5BQJ1_9MICO|nr:alpha-galactosidase [Pseudoclavibacter chungangensis]KAB1656284.1 alpha-galactosidase [Pseudoclavibacter chungangensis]NYJ67044.1 alpha-galactosidase [Pseudoclavibacter chungangensis]
MHSSNGALQERTTDESGHDDIGGRVLHLHRRGTSVVIDLSSDPVPVIVHWGEELVDSTPESLRGLAVAARPQRVSGGLDRTPRLSAIATGASGWSGTPAIEGHRGGAGFSIAPGRVDHESDDTAATFNLEDAEARLAFRWEIRIGSGGLLHQRTTVTNTGTDAYSLDRLDVAFPTPWDATELFDTTGHHLRERAAQRRAFTLGTHLRESRRGRPGADASVLLAAGRPGFGFESGRVHGIHVAWSGNHRVLAERTVTGEAFLAAGELFVSGEVEIAPGASVSTPWVIGSWGDGLNELSARFHAEWRDRPQHPTRPRPVTLNTWEAVYFDHDIDRLTSLAEAAAEVGIERFVLDDGWFTGRRDDTRGLGDWEVDAEVWQDGLHPLVDRVRELGMEFGLWVEPEMINPDSDLARAHPEWILRARTTLPPSARQQQVLNLADPDAYRHVADRLHALLIEYPIAYLKWDHNRDLVDAGSGPGGAPRVREHTLALYRLLDELKAAHPGLEIETCASGGARVDLGILDRTDRIWTSDSLDPLERLENQRHTGLVVPPEMMGMHLTSPVVHSSGRTVSLELSAAVALLGHFGVEWDLTSVDAVTRGRVASWIALAKRLRPLIAHGTVVHVDGVEPGIDVRGTVAADAASAVFVVTQVTTSAAYPAGRIRFPGLDPARTYELRMLSGSSHEPGQSPLAWAEAPITMTGRELATIGVRPPVQFPQQAVVVEIDSHH